MSETRKACLGDVYTAWFAKSRVPIINGAGMSREEIDLLSRAVDDLERLELEDVGEGKREKGEVRGLVD